jgi:hypothetical protein
VSAQTLKVNSFEATFLGEARQRRKKAPNAHRMHIDQMRTPAKCPVPCQKSHVGSELVFPAIVRLLSGTR